MICPKCGLPVDLCVCDEMAREEQKIRIRRDKRKFGKFVTVVEGFDDVDIQKIAKELKMRLACGGTAKNGKIELQGDHLNRVKNVLANMGFSKSMVD